MKNKELETWLEETKAKNLSKEELKKVTNNLDTVFYNKLRKELKVSGTLYEHLFNQWQKEAEFSPKRGDMVLVWDDNIAKAQERIFLANVKGCVNPILVVHSEYENEFKNNEWFKITEFEHMKPLPTEQPTETDFKSKVIELIEEKIEECKILTKAALKNQFYDTASKYNNKHEMCEELLNQIKQLC